MTIATHGACSMGNAFVVDGAGMLAVALDAPFFVYDMLTGDVSVTAKIKSISGTTADSLAGVMIRETLLPGSRFAAIAKSGVTLAEI